MAKHKIRLDAERNCVELTLPDGESKFYQPSYGSAADLFQDLKDAAHDDPTTVIEFLEAAAEEMTPADPVVSVDNPDGDEEVPEEGVLGKASGLEPDATSGLIGANNNFNLA